jgi:hypothetical protein
LRSVRVRSSVYHIVLVFNQTNSAQNYIDPRLTVVFANKFKVPIEKFFSKTLREKFNWAIESIENDDDWEF